MAEVKFIGITKSTDPTQKRAPWRIEYEKGGKRYARYETSHVKAIQLAEEKFGKPSEIEEIKLSGKMVEIPLVEGKAVSEADNPGRVRFDRASIDSTIAAAKRLESERNLYIFATHLGYTIDRRPPPGMQQYVIVHPDGSTETVKPFESNPTGGNPTKIRISEEEAIGMLERLSMTPDEARRSLFGSEEERRTIMKAVQERVKREQNKFAPFDPREGPPLPRIFGGLSWPWRKS